MTVLIAPIIPGLTDHEAASILERAAEAGASAAGMVLLRLPDAVSGIFLRWLKEHLPDRADRVVTRRSVGLDRPAKPLSVEAFRRPRDPPTEQLDLLDPELIRSTAR